MSQINISVQEFLDIYSSVTGFNSTSECALDLLNKARIIAYPMGDWIGTMVFRGIQVHCGLFILPSDLETIKSAKNMTGRSIGINSVIESNDYCSCSNPVIVRVDGRSYTPFQLTEDCPLFFYAANKKDADNQSALRVSYMTKEGSYHDEELIVGHGSCNAKRLIHSPKTVISISKDITVGPIVISQTDRQGLIDAKETRPQYTIYCAQDITDCCIAVHAKKRYRAFTSQNLADPIDINPEALSSLIIAVKAKEGRSQNWFQEYQASVKIASDFLKKEQQNERSTSFGAQPVQLTETFFNSIHNP